MTTATQTHTDELVQAADVKVQIRKGGKGEPLLVLHGELGLPGWLRAHEELSKPYTVWAPSLPGFGQSSRPEWIMNVRDLSAWTAWFIREMKLPTPLNAIGFSMGGWLAAEMALVNANLFKKLVLVAPMGVKPEKGEIFDFFMNSAKEAFVRCFFNASQSPEFAQYYGKEWTPEESDQVENNREMACRLTWKPYMYSYSLPWLLRGIATPTLIVWGRQDSVAPLNCCELYQKAIPGAQAKVIEACGHMPEMEKTSEFVKIVTDFLT